MSGKVGMLVCVCVWGWGGGVGVERVATPLLPPHMLAGLLPVYTVVYTPMHVTHPIDFYMTSDFFS